MNFFEISDQNLINQSQFYAQENTRLRYVNNDITFPAKMNIFNIFYKGN